MQFGCDDMDNVVWNIEKTLTVDIEVRSNIGGRNDQQDYAYISSLDNYLICTLCDGMGGMEYGSQASKIAAETINSHLSCSRVGELETSFEFPVILERAFRNADRRVRMSSNNSGTTAVTVVLQNGEIYWASIGDTRLYIFRKGELVQATRDHNYLLQLNRMRSDGYIPEKEFQEKMPMGHALISYLGMGNAELFDLTELPLRVQPEDVLLLATDGLYGVVPNEYMKSVFDTKMPLKEKADRLMGYVLKQSKEYVLDNTTFILIEI